MLRQRFGRQHFNVKKSGLSEFSQIQSINGAEIDPWYICTRDIDND